MIDYSRSLPDAVIVVDNEGRIVGANEQVEELLGWPPSDLMGQRIEVLVPDAQAAGHAVLRDAYQAAPRTRAMGGGLQLAARHRAGHSVPVDIALRAFDVDGKSYTTACVRNAGAYRPQIDELLLKAVALEEAANGIVITDTAGAIEWVNSAAARMTGYSREELLGQNPRILKSGVQDESYYADMWATISAGRPWQGVLINRRKDGTIYHEEQTITPVHDAAGAVTRFIAVKQDVTARVETEKALERARDALAFQAFHDPLTGLANRKLLEEMLVPALARARRQDLAVAIIFADLDDFKRVNDTLGHGAGDQLLKQVASRLQRSVREVDVVARHGGDEFIIMLPDIEVGDGGHGAALAAANRVVTRVHASMTEPFPIDGFSIYAAISIGIAVFPYDADDLRPLLKLADMAMYDAKLAGK